MALLFSNIYKVDVLKVLTLSFQPKSPTDRADPDQTAEAV